MLIHYWNNINIPIIIHAPTYEKGLNLSQKENENKNYILICEAKKYADTLNSNKIIFHSGIGGNIKETLKQLLEINDKN